MEEQKAFFLGHIAKRSHQNAVKGKKISTRIVIEEYKSAYILFAIKFIQRKYNEKTLSRAEIYEEEVMNNLMKGIFSKELDKEFAEAHPALLKLLKGTIHSLSVLTPSNINLPVHLILYSIDSSLQ